MLPEGARVFFSTTAGMAPGDGSLAERCLVRDDDVMVIGGDVADAALAALGMSGVAAWMCLTARARLLPGERVLVLGGGGAVGQAAIGAAKVLGAGRVVAVARSPEARERARLAGADEVLPLTGDVDQLTARFQDAVGGSVDVVIDPVFGIAATAASRVLAERGRLVNLGGSSGDVAEFSSAVLRSRTADILGYTNAALTPAERRAALAAVIEHAAAGRLAVAHEVLPLAAGGRGLASSGRRNGGRAAGAHALIHPRGRHPPAAPDRRRTPCSWSPRTTSPTWRWSAGPRRRTRAWPS